MTKQTNWEERFDEKFFDNWPEVHYGELKTFIHQNRKELVEEILADIPDDEGDYVFDGNDEVWEGVDLRPLKQQLRDKYLNTKKDD